MRHALCLVLVAATTAFAALGCNRECCAGKKKDAPIAVAQVIAPSAPVDPAFSACQKSCGSRSAKDRANAKAQPGAEPGDSSFCPVSGAVFMIKQDSPSHEITVKGETKKLFFCCPDCAKWFAQHEDEVLRARGLT